MRMYAALVPPPMVLDDLAAVVRSVRGREADLDPVPAERMHLQLGNFGNVGLTDRLALKETLTDEVAHWAPMKLRFRGGSALLVAGDDSVWAELVGDVEQLRAIGTVLPHVVHRLGFLIDRRGFQTRVRVGRITSATRLGYLERLLSRLEGYSGPAWNAHHISLVRYRNTEGAADPALEVLHELRLVGDADGTGDTGAAGGRHRGGDDADGGAKAAAEHTDERADSR